MVDFTGADGGLRELALFAGAGGGILGGHLLGWRTVCAVEWDPYAASVLAQRQNDGLLPPFPIWDDVQTFDGKPWRGVVDVVSGGFPCQDISVAGKGAGISGERSGMWSHMARIIGEVRPLFAFVENSPALLTRGLGVVLSDLAALGYDCKWTVLGAADVGAPHKRDRFWLVANASGGRCSQPQGREVEQQGRTEVVGASAIATMAHANSLRELQPQGGISDIGRRPCYGCGYVFDHDKLGIYGCPNCEGDDVPDSYETGPQGGIHHGCTHQEGRKEPEIRRPSECRPEWRWGGDFGWDAEPDVGRVAHGVAARVDRLRAIGNGQVPQCAAQAWRLLTDA